MASYVLHLAALTVPPMLAMQAGAARSRLAEAVHYGITVTFSNHRSTNCARKPIPPALLGVINTTIYPNRLVVSSYGAVRDRVVSWRRGAGTGYPDRRARRADTT